MHKPQNIQMQNTQNFSQARGAAGYGLSRAEALCCFCWHVPEQSFSISHTETHKTHLNPLDSEIDWDTCLDEDVGFTIVDCPRPPITTRLRTLDCWQGLILALFVQRALTDLCLMIGNIWTGGQ